MPMGCYTIPFVLVLQIGIKSKERACNLAVKTKLFTLNNLKVENGTGYIIINASLSIVRQKEKRRSKLTYCLPGSYCRG